MSAEISKIILFEDHRTRAQTKIIFRRSQAFCSVIWIKKRRGAVSISEILTVVSREIKTTSAIVRTLFFDSIFLFTFILEGKRRIWSQPFEVTHVHVSGGKGYINFGSSITTGAIVADDCDARSFFFTPFVGHSYICVYTWIFFYLFSF